MHVRRPHRRTTDLGSGFGYSALWLASGAGAGAKIICIDASAENLERSREFHSRAGLSVEFVYE